MKAQWRSTLTLIALGLASQALHAQPGGTWSFNANGATGVLSITLFGDGVVAGTMGGLAIKGFWNEGAQRLTFYRAVGGSVTTTPPDKIQIYTGYLFATSATTKRLTGEFVAFTGTGATATRHVFPWTATK
jgi:hypothetical protein